MKKIIKLVTLSIVTLLLGGCFQKNNLEDAKAYAQKWVDGITQKGWNAF